MTEPVTPKATFHRYLTMQREQLLAKLDGLSEYDMRRPMTATGTNLLGIVKHVASVQLGYLGEVFGRSSDRRLPWFDDDAEVNADMWATADEATESVFEPYRYSCDHADATIQALDIDAVGEVSVVAAGESSWRVPCSSARPRSSSQQPKHPKPSLRPGRAGRRCRNAGALHPATHPRHVHR